VTGEILSTVFYLKRNFCADGRRVFTALVAEVRATSAGDHSATPAMNPMRFEHAQLQG